MAGTASIFANVENVSDLQKEMSELQIILTPILSENLRKAYKAYLILEENEED